VPRGKINHSWGMPWGVGGLGSRRKVGVKEEKPWNIGTTTKSKEKPTGG